MIYICYILIFFKLLYIQFPLVNYALVKKFYHSFSKNNHHGDFQKQWRGEMKIL